MTLSKKQAHLDALVSKHNELDLQLTEAYKCYASDSVVKAMKMEKLGLKEEIVQLQQEIAQLSQA